MSESKIVPIISVIMPVYNTEMYLPEAIDSVINQTFQKWELICVNDGSTDNSLEILRYYEALDKRIVVINQKHSGTASAARNMALKNAKGEYMQMLDSDDFLSTDCLEKNMKVALSTQADFIIPDLVQFKDNNTRIGSIIGFHGDRQKILTSKEAFIASLSWEISGVGLFRTKLVKKFQYDETGMNGDEYTTRLLLLNCNRIAFSTGQYFYRLNSNSTTQKISIKRLDILLTSFKILNLAEENDFNEDEIYLCKKKIVDDLLISVKYFINNKNNFSETERSTATLQLKQYFNKVDKTYFRNESNLLKYLIKKILFVDFQIFKFYAYLVWIKKKL
jgi:glycosyltransferase involved in cell wall biosynthesis